MKTTLAITALTLFGFLPLGAQNVQQDPPEDQIQKAIREFNNRDKGKPNEVTVVLAPAATEKPSDDPAEPPVLVTGTAPHDTELAATSETAASDAIPAAEESPPEPASGLAVRVKELQSGSGDIDPSKVKLLAPFPAKPLAEPPAGWHLESSDAAPPFSREVEISSGKSITLTIRPHLLVPDTDGINSFNITEPGYDASLGYYQQSTVAAIVSKSIHQLEDDSKNLGMAIDRLQQILVSLPGPDLQPESKPATKSK